MSCPSGTGLRKKTMPTTNVTIDPQALGLPSHVVDLLDTCAGWAFPRTREEILDLAMGGKPEVFERE
jgi:hypothetical protein